MDERACIRNVGVLGELKKGKTSLTETLVAAYKASETRGEEQEQEQCIAIKSVYALHTALCPTTGIAEEL